MAEVRKAWWADERFIEWFKEFSGVDPLKLPVSGFSVHFEVGQLPELRIRMDASPDLVMQLRTIVEVAK